MILHILRFSLMAHWLIEIEAFKIYLILTYFYTSIFGIKHLTIYAKRIIPLDTFSPLHSMFCRLADRWPAASGPGHRRSSQCSTGWG